MPKKLKNDPSTWKWFGNAGHLCVSSDCRFHLCTQVGLFMVSTVGEYRPAHKKDGFETVGGGRLYETMVFNAGKPCSEKECGKCGMPIPGDWGELDMAPYNTAAAATKGHYAMCLKWANRAKLSS